MDLSEFRQKVEEIKQIQNEICSEIFKKIEQTPPLEGVKPVGKNMATVSLSMVRENRFVLSADFYIQEKQNEAMLETLRPYKTDLEKLLAKINEMIEKQSAFPNAGKDKKVPLNSSSLKSLRNIIAEIA